MTPAPTAAAFRAALYAHLAATADLVDVVGSEIHPNRLPQSAELPAVGFKVARYRPTVDMDGADGRAEATVQAEARADVLADAQAAADAVRESILALTTGGILGAAAARVRIRWAAPDGGVDQDPEEPTDGSDDAAFRVVEVFRFEVETP